MMFISYRLADRVDHVYILLDLFCHISAFKLLFWVKHIVQEDMLNYRYYLFN